MLGLKSIYICKIGPGDTVVLHKAIVMYRDDLKHLTILLLKYDFDGLVQDCSISIANSLEILQSCLKP